MCGARCQSPSRERRDSPRPCGAAARKDPGARVPTPQYPLLARRGNLRGWEQPWEIDPRGEAEGGKVTHLGKRSLTLRRLTRRKQNTGGSDSHSPYVTNCVGRARGFEPPTSWSRTTPEGSPPTSQPTQVPLPTRQSPTTRPAETRPAGGNGGSVVATSPEVRPFLAGSGPTARPPPQIVDAILETARPGTHAHLLGLRATRPAANGARGLAGSFGGHLDTSRLRMV
jgi:hypothetical protein